MSALRTPRSTGKVRPARLTDLAALGELSRLCQSDGADTRSLGLPVNGPPIGVFSLFRLPLGAFRPNDLMFVIPGYRLRSHRMMRHSNAANPIPR